MPDSFSKPKRFFRVLKAIFISSFPMNLLFLIVIIAASIFAFSFLTPEDTPTANVIVEQECPECICEEQECEQDCDLCPVKTKVETQEIIKYSCPDKSIVESLEDCQKNFPEVPEENSATVEGISFFINNIEYEKDEENSGFVTRVDYTIINQGDLPIVPKIEVKVYEEWNLKTKSSVANKIINPEIVVNPNEYARRQDRVRIYFDSNKQTVRLLLVDSLPTIEREIVAVTKDIELS